MRAFILVLALLTIAPMALSETVSEIKNVQLEMRGYDEITLPQGTFIPVITTQEISTETCPVGFKVKFIATSDLFMYETNIIPRNTEFYGYIEKINEPVVGTNASMKIRISKMAYSDGYELPLKGYLYTSNNNLFGGGISEPVKYKPMAQRQIRVKKTTIQMVPSYERKMGTHTTIKAGSNEIIILTSPTWITHTLTN